jgi:hypothetical protein
VKRIGSSAPLLVTALLMALGASPALAESPPPKHPVRPGPLATPALIAAITAADHALFEAGFDTCDIAALGELIAEDFEFYHDKSGKIASNGTQFLDAARGSCERQKAGTDIKARRELVEGSMVVYPVANFGAIQQGSHRFWGLEPGKPAVLRETAHFFHLWKEVDGKWKLSRVFSFDHRPAE